MAAQTGPGIKGLESERLGLGGLDDFEDVHSHPQAEHFEFIDQGNVDRPIDVFQQLAHFRRLGGGYGDHPFDHLGVKGHAVVKARRGHAAHYLGNGAHLELALPGSSRSGEKTRKKSWPTRSRVLKESAATASSGPGIGGGFQRNQLPCLGSLNPPGAVFST